MDFVGIFMDRGFLSYGGTRKSSIDHFSIEIETY